MPRHSYTRGRASLPAGAAGAALSHASLNTLFARHVARSRYSCCISISIASFSTAACSRVPCRLKPYDPTSSGRNLVAPATSRCCRVFTNCPHLRHICVCLVVAALSKRTKTRRATQPQPPSLSVSSTHPASRVQARWCAQCSRMRSTCAAAPRARNHHLSARHTPHVRHTCVTPQNPSHMCSTLLYAPDGNACCLATII